MAVIASIGIDLMKIDRTKIVEGKNGAKWLQLSVVINDEVDKFGNDASISIGQSKEEHDRKDKRTYLGNGRVVWRNDGKPIHKTNPDQGEITKPAPSSASPDDLPF